MVTYGFLEGALALAIAGTVKRGFTSLAAVFFLSWGLVVGQTIQSWTSCNLQMIFRSVLAVSIKTAYQGWRVLSSVVGAIKIACHIIPISSNRDSRGGSYFLVRGEIL